MLNIEIASRLCLTFKASKGRQSPMNSNGRTDACPWDRANLWLALRVEYALLSTPPLTCSAAPGTVWTGLYTSCQAVASWASDLIILFLFLRTVIVCKIKLLLVFLKWRSVVSLLLSIAAVYLIWCGIWLTCKITTANIFIWPLTQFEEACNIILMICRDNHHIVFTKTKLSPALQLCFSSLASLQML